MAATPQNAIFKFRGLRTGQTYNISTYLSDVAAQYAKFDEAAKAAATSLDYWTPPEPVNLTDVIIGAATVDCLTLQVLRNGKPTGDLLFTTVHLASVVNRPALTIMFTPLVRIQIKQAA